MIIVPMITLAFALLANTQLIQATVPQLNKPTIQSVQYDVAEQKVEVYWKSIKQAKRYRVKLYHQDTLIKRITTTHRTAVLSATLFETDTTYRFEVRALKTAQRRASPWAEKRYTHTVETIPELSPLVENTAISGITLWTFVVDDGQEQPAISGENNGSVFLGRLNLATPGDAISWTRAIQPADFGNKNIADHWHIFAHGFHWIVVSVNSAQESYLVKLDTNFTVLATYPVVINETYQDNTGQTLTLATNDMFLVEEPTGVAVGHFLAGTGHRVYRFNTAGELIEKVDIGGGEYVHANGASVVMTADGYTVFAPGSLNPSQSSPLKRLEFNGDWEPQSVTTLIEEDQMNIAMATAVLINDDLIVTARVVDTTTKENSGDDSGSIVRYVFDQDDQQISRTEVYADTGNRPHTTKIDDQLITGWDSADSFVRIDEIEAVEVAS